MEGAVVNYAGGAVQPLLGKLGQLLREEVRQLRGVRGEVAHFRDELATMNALLRTLTEAGDNVDHLTREWMKQVRELAYDAEDCIDVFELRISRAPRTESTCVDVLGDRLHLLATLGPRRRLSADIKALRVRALAIGERHTRYSLDRRVPDFTASYGAGGTRTGAVRERQAGDSLDRAAVDATASSDHLLVATAHAPRADGSSQYVGIEDQTATLATWVTEEAGDEKLKVISIVGFGGLGKTTLAMAVCRSVAQEFYFQASVSVSQAWDLRDVLRRILKQIVDRNKGGVNKLCIKLRDLLKESAMDVNELRTKLRGLLEEDTKLRTKLRDLLKEDAMDVNELRTKLRDLLKEDAMDVNELRTKLRDLLKEDAMDVNELRTKLRDLLKEDAMDVNELRTKLRDLLKENAMDVNELRTKLRDLLEEDAMDVKELCTKLRDRLKEDAMDVNELCTNLRDLVKKKR